MTLGKKRERWIRTIADLQRHYKLATQLLQPKRAKMIRQEIERLRDRVARADVQLDLAGQTGDISRQIDRLEKQPRIATPVAARSPKWIRWICVPFVMVWRFLQTRFFSPAKNAGLLAEKMSSSSSPAPASSRRRASEENCYSPIAPGQGSER